MSSRRVSFWPTSAHQRHPPRPVRHPPAQPPGVAAALVPGDYRGEIRMNDKQIVGTFNFSGGR
jgi:hypothetical protein